MRDVFLVLISFGLGCLFMKAVSESSVREFCPISEIGIGVMITGTKNGLSVGRIEDRKTMFKNLRISSMEK